MNTRKSIFFSRSSVRIQLYDTKGVKSHSENRKLYEETLVSGKVYLFHTDFSPNSTLQATWIQTYLKLLRFPLFGGQPCRLTNSFVEYYRFDSLMSQLFKSLGYETYLKLLRFPLLGGQPCRLTNSFVECYRFDSLMLQLFNLLGYERYLK